MRYFSSLFALRLIIVFLLVLLILDFKTLISAIFWLFSLQPMVFESAERDDLSLLFFGHWNDIDIIFPPSLNGSLEESQRLTEFLARPQYKCATKTRVGVGFESFFICAEGNKSNTLSHVAFLSGMSLRSDTSYLHALTPKKWTLFVPDDFVHLDDLGAADIEVNYLMNLRNSDDWNIGDISDAVNSNKYDLAFLELYYSQKRGYKFNQAENQWVNAPKLILTILERLKAKQLHVVVDVGPPKTAGHVLYLWYRAFLTMFYQYGYALMNAETKGMCNRIVQNCQYRLSFIQHEIDEVEPPVFNFGSPLDERGRLVKYFTNTLNSSETHCDIRHTDVSTDVPPVCLNTLVDSQPCNLIYIRHRHTSSPSASFVSVRCSAAIFSPYLAESQLNSTDIKLFNFGVSPSKSKSLQVPGADPDSEIHLIPFDEIVNKGVHPESDLAALLFDLEGDEWTVMNAILQSPETLCRAKQIAFRLRLWIGEENENARKFYSYFLRLERLGYEKVFFSAVDVTTFFCELSSYWTLIRDVSPLESFLLHTISFLSCNHCHFL
ncbi:hypothetical protein AB6A40_005110 [Gnathostoma spinigerum]|uniref:Methyltransferase domain-containing protein n=1 Tax=Gnathostoma spinigerum TaxID=75299 RepID=A0ABD6ELV0_9BILA